MKYCPRKVGVSPDGEHFTRYCSGDLTFTLAYDPSDRAINPVTGCRDTAEAIRHFSACRTCGEMRWQREGEWIVIRGAANPEAFTDR